MFPSLNIRRYCGQEVTTEKRSDFAAVDPEQQRAIARLNQSHDIGTVPNLVSEHRPFALRVAAPAAESKIAILAGGWPSTALHYAQAERSE